MRRFRLLTIVACLVTLLTWTGLAAADGIIIVDPPPDIPPIRLDEALTIRYHRVTVTIRDQVATTHVDQLFLNEHRWTAEGTYLFPLPAGAAVDQFVMWVDGKPITAEILQADQARQIYQDIVNRMRDPALLEYVGRDMVKASIFPIPAGEERRIELEYSQVLPVENGLVRYLYPLSTEKYSARPLEQVSIRVELQSPEPIKAVYSPSHEVYIERDGDYAALVGLEQSNVKPDKDFELYYTVSPEDVGLNLLSYREAGEDGFFLLLVAPNVEVSPDQVVAKDVVFVLDVSGSMAGEKLVQAKEAVVYTLSHLNPQDRFSVIAFSTGLRRYHDRLAPAGDWESAVDFTRRLEAMGGTDINRALLEALNMVDPERPTTLIFVTDGLATEGVYDTPAILSNFRQAASANVRLFSFGVGNDVDTDLLDALALDQGGTSAYVRPGQRIDEQISAFYAKVSTPVMSDVQIVLGGIQGEQMFPAQMPDLFAGSQLILAGRYREGGPMAATLSGVVNGERVTFRYPDQYLVNHGGDAFIPRLWATRAIGHYLTQIRLYGENPEWVKTIVDLSIRYGIITPYTSFLIDEDDIFTQIGRQTLAESTQEEMAGQAAAPSFGADAVNKAAEEGVMREAPAPAALPTITAYMPGMANPVVVADVIRHVGSKTFVVRGDIWMDTEFDPSVMDPSRVGFLTDDYFALVAAAPGLGSYFALGEQVIVVFDGVAYQVVLGAGDSVPIPAPTPSEVSTPSQPANVQKNEPVSTPDQVASGSAASSDPTSQPAATKPSAGKGGLCAGAMALPAFLGVVGLLSGAVTRRRQRF